MKRLVSFLVCFALTSCLAVASGTFEVLKRVDATYGEVHYGIRDDACLIEWVMDDPDNPGEFPGLGIRERLETALTPSEQAPYRRALLQAVRSDTHDFQGLLAFSWGRLRGSKAYELYTDRLVALVGKSTHWDKKKARVIGYPKGAGNLIEELLNREDIFPEIREVFRAEGLELRVGDVEEVVVGTVGKDGKIGFGKSKRDKYPVDFLFTFFVTKNADPSAPLKP